MPTILNEILGCSTNFKTDHVPFDRGARIKKVPRSCTWCISSKPHGVKNHRYRVRRRRSARGHPLATQRTLLSDTEFDKFAKQKRIAGDRDAPRRACRSPAYSNNGFDNTPKVFNKTEFRFDKKWIKKGIRSAKEGIEPTKEWVRSAKEGIRSAKEGIRSAKEGIRSAREWVRAKSG